MQSWERAAFVPNEDSYFGIRLTALRLFASARLAKICDAPKIKRKPATGKLPMTGFLKNSTEFVYPNFLSSEMNLSARGPVSSTMSMTALYS